MKMVPVVFDCKEIRLPDGELMPVMMPQDRYTKVVRRQFVIGESYPLVVLEARSRASHDQYFAAVNDGFKNLPENISARWPSEEHLRKWVLVETGWCDENETTWDSKRDAMRHASYIRANVDEYARISVHAVGGKYKLIARHAQSQSAAAMTKQIFEASKKDVLLYIESMIGLERGKLKKNAGRSA